MADEQYRWLDRETAERLLRGEPLEAVDAASRDQAERLAKTLGELSVEPPLSSAELPGEAAAVAAFRKVREERAGERGAEWTASGKRAGGHSSDAGVIRIGAPDRPDRRPRWGRPMRLGLSAAVAACMAGGVAVAATTGVLPTPFGGGEPGPAASVSAAVTPDRPRVSPSPNAGQSEPTPDGATSGPSGRSPSPRGSAGKGPAPATGTEGRQSFPGGRWNEVTSACRDLRDGRELSAARKHTLENAAGGAPRVGKYCKGVLAAGTAGDDGQGEDRGKGGPGDSDGGRGKGNAKGKGNGHGEGGKGGDGDSHHIAPGGSVVPSSTQPLVPQPQTRTPSPGPTTPQAPATLQGPTPDPTYSAL